MNLRHKNLVLIIRILFGLLFVFSGVSGLLIGSSTEGVPASLVSILKALMDTGIFHMIKITELVAGFLLIFNIFPALAVILLAPISVGILVFNARVSPEFIGMGLILCLINAYLGYAYWDKYKTLFSRK